MAQSGTRVLSSDGETPQEVGTSRSRTRTEANYRRPVVQIQPVDLTGTIAVIMGTLMFLIPIAGITARFALKPLVESFATLFQDQRIQDTVAITERRVALLESQIESLENQLSRVRDAQDFDRRLEAGAPTSGVLQGGASDSE